LIPDWFAWAAIERGLSPGTLRKYRATLHRLEAFAAEPISQLKAPALRAFMQHRPGSPSTQTGRLAALRSFYGWLVRSDQREDDPTTKLDRPKVRRTLPRPVAELARKLQKLEPAFKAAALFLAETGLRISEACSLDVPLPVPTELIVLGKGRKERLIPLTDLARASLEALDGRMPASARTIERHFRRAGFTPHQLRHTIATEMAKAGADVTVIQDLLGHASPATTRIYFNNDVSRIREGLDRRRTA
jgi:integrase/recombinase XerD